MTGNEALYEDYHRMCAFPGFGSDTFQGDKVASIYSNVKNVLDFGCGNGFAVRLMRDRGSQWFGVEYSRTAFERDLQEPFFFHGDTRQFHDRQFELAYSTEVFEHIPEDLVSQVICDLCRVTSKYIFLTISLRPSSNNNSYHCTLKSRRWWETQFCQYGMVVDKAVVHACQDVRLRTTRSILRQWSSLGPKAEQFCRQPPYKLHGETQFWFFAFRRKGIPATQVKTPFVRWRRRVLNRLVHSIISV